MANEDTDHDLLARFYQNDDDSALAVFVERHRDWALKQARRYFVEEAEDIVQLSILRLMDSQPVDGVVTHPLGWWRAIISATAMNKLRNAIRRREREQDAVDIAAIKHIDTDLDESVARKQLISLIHEELDRMDERLRGPLLKRYFEDLSYREISNILKLSPGTVASRLARGIAHIRESLVHRGVLVFPSNNQGAITMSDNNSSIVEKNKEFAAKWRDIWTVLLDDNVRVLGRITSSIDNDGNVEIRWRLDTDLHDSPTRDRTPEFAKDCLWSEREIVLTDVDRFTWSHFRASEGSMKSKTAGWDYQFKPSSENTVCVSSIRDAQNAARIMPRSQDNQSEWIINPESDQEGTDGNSSVIPDMFMPLYICNQPLDEKSNRTVQWLSFEVKENGRKWMIQPSYMRYAGRKGLPTGLSHTFELSNPRIDNNVFSIWVDNDGALIGMSDNRQSILATEDEVNARGLVSRGRC